MRSLQGARRFWRAQPPVLRRIVLWLFAVAVCLLLLALLFPPFADISYNLLAEDIGLIVGVFVIQTLIDDYRRRSLYAYTLGEDLPRHLLAVVTTLDRLCHHVCRWRMTGDAQSIVAARESAKTAESVIRLMRSSLAGALRLHGFGFEPQAREGLVRYIRNARRFRGLSTRESDVHFANDVVRDGSAIVRATTSLFAVLEYPHDPLLESAKRAFERSQVAMKVIFDDWTVPDGTYRSFQETRRGVVSSYHMKGNAEGMAVTMAIAEWLRET